jgi:hypothetical protein
MVPRDKFPLPREKYRDNYVHRKLGFELWKREEKRETLERYASRINFWNPYNKLQNKDNLIRVGDSSGHSAICPTKMHWQMQRNLFLFLFLFHTKWNFMESDIYLGYNFLVDTN